MTESENRSKNRSEYAGLEKRLIKSISDEDLNTLRKGGSGIFGGLGLSAELNNFPGPMHVLRFEKELKLSDEQRKNIQQIADEKQREAISIGEEFIAAEKHLDSHFVNASMSGMELKDLTARSAEIFGRLRYCHLISHLKTKELLSKDQVNLYNKICGYSK
jgi:hypothetical protein